MFKTKIGLLTFSFAYGAIYVCGIYAADWILSKVTKKEGIFVHD